MDSLTASLQRFGIKSVASFANAFPARNPIDIYRAHLATVLAPLAGVTPEVVYPVLSWTSALDKGDLSLPVPALRIKDKKNVIVFAKMIADNVRLSFSSIDSYTLLTLELVP